MSTIAEWQTAAKAHAKAVRERKVAEDAENAARLLYQTKLAAEQAALATYIQVTNDLPTDP